MIVEREIDGVLYKAQYKGMNYAFSLSDLLKSKKPQRQLTDILFSDILLTPKVKANDFENLTALDEVRSFLLEVALGDFETPKSDTKLKQIVEEQKGCYRLVVNEVCPLDYDLVFNRLTPQEIKKLNFALDKVYARINRQFSKK